MPNNMQRILNASTRVFLSFPFSLLSLHFSAKFWSPPPNHCFACSVVDSDPPHFPPPRHYLHALNLPLCFNAFPHTLFSFPSPPGPQLFLHPFASLEPLILSTVFLLLLPRLVRSPPLHFRFWHRSLVNSLDLSLALFLFSLCANSRTWTLYASCLASPNTSCMEKTRPPTPGSPHRSTNEIANTFAAEQNKQTLPQSVIRDLGAHLEDFRCKETPNPKPKTPNPEP